MDSLHAQDYEESASLLHKSLQILKLSKPSESLFKLKAVTLNNLGILYYTIKDYPKALQYLSSALEVSRNLSTDAINRAGTHLNICAIKSGLNQHEQALQHALTAIQTLNMKKSEFSPSLVVAYHSAGIEYQFLNLPLKARSYFEYGFNLAAQKLGKNHNLTVTLEEALQDYYGYKVKTRQKSNDGYLAKIKVNEGYNKDKTEKKYPKFMSPLEKIYKQGMEVKNRPEQSFLDSPQKIRKRVFVRQEVNSRVRNMIMQNKIRDESFKNFNVKAVSHFDKKYEESEESEEVEESEVFETEEIVEIKKNHIDKKPSLDTEGLINKFREDIAEGSREESSFKLEDQVSKNIIRPIPLKTADPNLIQKNFSIESIKRDVFSSPCNFENSNKNLEANKELDESEKKFSESEKKFSESEKKFSKSEKKFSESEKIFSESEKNLSESEKNLSESESVKSLKINESKLKIIEDTIQHLDEKVKAFSEDHKKLIFFQTELKEPTNDLQVPNRENQALLIQKNFRGWVKKVNFKRIRNEVIKIQKAWRECRYRKYLKRIKDLKKDFSQQLNESMFILHPEKINSEAQTETQKRPENQIETKNLGFIQPYNMYKSFYKTIVYIQARIRGFLCRKLKKKRFKAVTKVQAGIRMHQTRRIFLNIVQAIIFIQQMYRLHLQKKKSITRKNKKRCIKK